MDIAAKSWRSLRVKFAGLALIEFDHLPEEVLRQQADAVSKEAEQQAHEEMRGVLWVNAPSLQAVGELGKLRQLRVR